MKSRNDEILELMLERCDFEEREILMESLHEIVNHELFALAATTESQQAAIGKANHERHLAAGHGIGPMTHRLGAYEAAHERILFGHDTKDPDFLKSQYFRDKYPHAAVNAGGEKEIHVGYTKEQKHVTPIFGATGQLISAVETQSAPGILA